MLAELRSKSQITIPKQIVSSLNLNEGDKLEITEKDGVIQIVPVAVYPKKYIDEIQDDKDKELKDYMTLRAYRDNVEIPFLKQKDKEWMMASISEFRTNDPYAKMAHGKVLTFGLGIGYFVYNLFIFNMSYFFF